jgi:hypothetical protein
LLLLINREGNVLVHHSAQLLLACITINNLIDKQTLATVICLALGLALIHHGAIIFNHSERRGIHELVLFLVIVMRQCALVLLVVVVQCIQVRVLHGSRRCRESGAVAN